MPRSRPLLGCLALAAAVSCNGDAGPNVSGVPAANISDVVITPALDTILVADTIRTSDRLRLSAAVLGRSGAPIAGARVAWESADPLVATVDSTGVVTPVAFGRARIVASAAKRDTALVVVAPATERVALDATSGTIIVDEPIDAGDTLRLRPRAFAANGQAVAGVRFAWSTSDPAVASVDTTGRVLALALGSATITARNEASGQSAAVAVRVVPLVQQVTLASPAARVLAGDTVQLTAVALGQDGKPIARRAFTWTSSAPAVATVDSAGRAHFVSTGSATFSARSGFQHAEVTVAALERRLLALDSGGDVTCGTASLGRAYCWGLADFGQIGSAADSACFGENPQGAQPCTLLPKRVATPDLEFAQISMGESFGCGVTTDGSLYCWGDGRQGQIGNGRAVVMRAPTLATARGERFSVVSAGGAHACALSISNVAYCWGSDVYGQLGDSLRVNSTTPIPVAGHPSVDGTAPAYATFGVISVGGTHACGLTSAGAAWCWGSNAMGQLGDTATFFVRPGTSDTSFYRSPYPVAVPGTVRFRAIAAGSQHTCALTTTGAVYCWGSNLAGQLGLGTSDSLRHAPALVPGLVAAQLQASDSVTCALDAAGVPSCWGDNGSGQLGIGELGGIRPRPMAITTALRFRSISPGRRHTCAIGTDGESYCWGSNIYGALGNELQADARTLQLTRPEKVAALR